MRVENAKELTSDVLIANLRSASISVTAVPPYSQYLNDVTEKFIGTLMGLVRAMLSNSELSLMFRADSAIYATSIYNRSPHNSNSGKTPFEVHFSKQPSLHHYLILLLLSYLRRISFSQNLVIEPLQAYI